MIKLIQSGFQTGADIGGIKAARQCGINTGGWINDNCQTLDGPRPEYIELYGASKCGSNKYKDRTWKNVETADATIRFATVWNSPGEKCTWNAIEKYDKSYFNVDLNDPHYDLCVDEVAEWIEENEIAVLNVAGNAEKTSPDIENKVYEFCVQLFNKLKERDNG
jgi:hypothetical protein